MKFQNFIIWNLLISKDFILKSARFARRITALDAAVISFSAQSALKLTKFGQKFGQIFDQNDQDLTRILVITDHPGQFWPSPDQVLDQIWSGLITDLVRIWARTGHPDQFWLRSWPDLVIYSSPDLQDLQLCKIRRSEKVNPRVYLFRSVDLRSHRSENLRFSDRW